MSLSDMEKSVEQFCEEYAEEFQSPEGQEFIKMWEKRNHDEDVLLMHRYSHNRQVRELPRMYSSNDEPFDFST